MARRLDLHNILLTFTDNVYFQPDQNIKLQYPAITYHRQQAATEYGGNLPYLYENCYLITYIDRNPDSPNVDAIAKLPKTKHDRTFRADGLNHDTYITYF